MSLQPAAETCTPSDDPITEEVAPRRTVSDPTVSPRERKRAPTPFPKAENKKLFPPSRIPRFAPQRSRQNIDVVKKNDKKQQQPVPGALGVKKSSTTSLKTIFYPKQQLSTTAVVRPPKEQPSTTVFHPPRELVFTPSDDEGHPDRLTSPLSPRRLLQRQSSPIPRGPRPALRPPPLPQPPPKPVIICKALDRDPSQSRPPSSSRRPSRGKVFDSDGYIQGPHTTHNRYIDLYDPPPPRTTESVNFEDNRDRGDCTSRGLPPLPPNGKRPNSKSRLATATISPAFIDSCYDPYYYNTRAITRSDLVTAPLPGLPFSANNNSNSSSPRRFGFTPNFSTTSLLSRVHEAASLTNLHHNKKAHNSDTEIVAAKCPLCAAKGQCHLHHRTMCSRYLTDLEWRICHAVNIYVYKNGEEGQTPILVHIPPSKKKNMKSVMSVIQERITYPIGYAKYLYRMNGKKVTSPCELEMYNNYVVASNYDKIFKPVCYARRKSPLLVLAKESKHVRELRLKNYQYELYLAKKRALGEERPDSAAGDAFYQTVGTIFPPPAQAPNQQVICEEIPCSFRMVPAPAAALTTSRACPKKNKRLLVECTSDYRPPQEFIVQNCTISTAPLKQQHPRAEMQGNQHKDGEDSGQGRFKPLANENESIFYSSRKPSKGVIDATGGKKFFYQERQQHQEQQHNQQQHQQQQQPKPGGDSDFEEIHKPKYDPLVYSAVEDSETESYFAMKQPAQQQQQSTYSHTQNLSHSTIQQSHTSVYQGTGDGHGQAAGQATTRTTQISTSQAYEGTTGGSNNQQSYEAATNTTQRQAYEVPTNASSQRQFYEVRNNASSQKQTNSPQKSEDSPEAQPETTCTAISAPSRSYTIITPQIGAAYSPAMPTAQYSERIVYRVSGVAPTVAPPSRLALNDNSGNTQTVESAVPYQYERVQMHSDNVTSGSEAVANSFSAYQYGSSPTGAGVTNPQHSYQQQIPFTSQRLSYGTLVDNSRLRTNQPNNFYSTDEVDIPYSPPMYTHRQGLVQYAQYQQVPLTSRPPGAQQSGEAPRNFGLVAIRKPSKRNVAIQMGVPSTLDDDEDTPGTQYDPLQTARPSPGIYNSSPALTQCHYANYMPPRQPPTRVPGQQSNQVQLPQRLSQQQIKHQQLYQARQQMLLQQRYISLQQEQVAYAQQQQYSSNCGRESYGLSNAYRATQITEQPKPSSQQARIGQNFQYHQSSSSGETSRSDPLLSNLSYQQQFQLADQVMFYQQQQQQRQQHLQNVNQQPASFYEEQRNAMQSNLRHPGSMDNYHGNQCDDVVAQGTSDNGRVRNYEDTAYQPAQLSRSGGVVPPPTRYRDGLCDNYGIRTCSYQNSLSRQPAQHSGGGG